MNRYNVLVTKPLSINQLQSIISDFCRKKINFAINKTKDDKFEIWRESQPDDPNAIIQKISPDITSMHLIYSGGLLISK